MKKNLLLIIFLFIAVCNPTNASMNVEQMTEPDYIMNNGYSEATAEQIVIMKSRISGRPVEPLYEKHRSGFVRFFRNIYGYLDPSIDTDERVHHDIHMSPSPRDL